jgi:hypothetical protein
MVTPFDKRGEVGLHVTEAVVKRLIEAGVDGIPALGSIGEFSHLTNHNSAYRFPGRAWSRPARPGGGARGGSRIRSVGLACRLAREIR